jgi:hypothetical protein
MSISEKDLRILGQKSGNRCAFPDCGELLTLVDASPNDGMEISVSDIAHIVARSSEGPRGKDSLPHSERDNVENLILLCQKHHRLIDQNPAAYPVEKLRWIKANHEKLIQDNTARMTATAGRATRTFVREPLYSTFLPVERMPMLVYSAQTTVTERSVSERLIAPADKSLMCPFIVRGERLYCFNDLFKKDNPFAASISRDDIKKEDALGWWCDGVRLRHYQELLNRSLNKLTGRKGLMLDREHHRYYFLPDKGPKGEAQSLKIRYTPLNARSAERSVAWQPIVKKTGLPRPYWYHLAVSLKFQLVGRRSWVLTIRPEFWVTADGFAPLPPKKIGAKITKKMARIFNIDLLEDVQFWRSFLSDDLPKIILQFGPGQQAIISSSTVQQMIEWPGLPEEFRRKFTNVDFDDDLFSLSERESLDEPYEDDLDEEAEEDEEEAE